MFVGSPDENARAGCPHAACSRARLPIRSYTASLVEQRLRCYCDRMTLKARVKAGRLVVDEPTDLPEGTEIELLPLDPGDWLDEEDRAALHQALKDSDEDIKAGRLVDADVILRELRSR
jgi:hypothetical protein